ncbi:O-acyltransferase WSD1-like [Hibiscus syriacus]|uniref:O-acyltransferase WSD1-like n=1 Tax=Hibiscus syriacus TaxID=106335 RepID=A0A6A3CYA0_HIBSY|nr:uncharacterized protein LOC120125006 [Hibiscus syriacus]KAE8733374.1 O-acyltransferase WSD1-like [Hibiscus syriacus]
MEGDLLDWEVLHSSDSESNSMLVNAAESRNLESIEGDTVGMIRSDYFSLNNQSMYAKEGDVSEEGSIESDNPSWIDPKPVAQYRRNNSGEFWSDSGSDRSDDRKLSDLVMKKDLEFAENEKAPDFLQGVGKVEGKTDELCTLKPDVNKISEFDRLKELGFGEFGDIQDQDKDLDKFWPDSGGDVLISMKFDDIEKDAGFDFCDCMEKGAELENSGELDNGNSSTLESEVGVGNTIANEGSTIDEMKLCARSANEGDKKKVTWWKVPFELLRYCVLRVSPAWSFSVAAAVMGFVILGRRLYKMKRRSSSLQLRVTMDDKKVSQFMTRVARLNEAFSVVRRVPIIRPSLSTPTGVNPWPVMSLRLR